MAKREAGVDPSFNTEGDPTIASLIAEGHVSIRITLTNGSQGIAMVCGGTTTADYTANRDILAAVLNRMIRPWQKT